MGCVCMSNITMMELSRELDEQFDRLVNECRVSGEINQELYTEYDVKRGLRDANGKGVLTGLTEISDVLSYKSVNGKKMPADGELYFQGYNVRDLIGVVDPVQWLVLSHIIAVFHKNLPYHTICWRCWSCLIQFFLYLLHLKINLLAGRTGSSIYRFHTSVQQT